jgi:purine-binding chemotaxis protein CheW
MTDELNQKKNDIFLIDENEDTMENRFLSFRIDKEDYGISIKNIIEIIELQKVIEIPDMPNYIKGVINLRGNVIPVMDLRLKFKIEEKSYDDRTCIIIISVNNYRVGLIVDRVEEVLEIQPENIEPSPKFKNNSESKEYISGLGKIGDSVKILLDVEKILTLEVIDVIKENANEINIRGEENVK